MSPTRSSQALLEAALDLIADNGIDALTLSQVAERAGVSRATAYREFGDRKGLLGAIAQHEIARMCTETFDGVPIDGAPAELISGVVVNALRFLRNHTAFTYIRDHEPHWLLHAVLRIDEVPTDLVHTVAAMAAPLMQPPSAELLALPPLQAAEVVVRTVLSHSLIEASTLSDSQVGEVTARAILTPQ